MINNKNKKSRIIKAFFLKDLKNLSPALIKKKTKKVPIASLVMQAEAKKIMIIIQSTDIRICHQIINNCTYLNCQIVTKLNKDILHDPNPQITTKKFGKFEQEKTKQNKKKTLVSIKIILLGKYTAYPIIFPSFYLKFLHIFNPHCSNFIKFE